MKIIVGGANDITRSIVSYLSCGNNDIIVIDKDEKKLNEIASEWDILPICGLVSHPDILKKAEAFSADLLIAATESDEVNMIACQAAHTLFDIPRRIARIDARGYLKASWGDLFADESLPIDLVFSPEYEIAKTLMNIVKVPGMSAVYSLANKKLNLLSFRITKKSPLVQIPLNRLERAAPGLNIMIVNITRGGKIIFPTGEDMLHGGDEINLLVENSKIEDVVHHFGLEHKANERVVIVGGNKIALYLAERLEADDNIISSKVIDDNLQSAAVLAEQLDKTVVFSGSIMSEAILEETGIDTADALVAVDFEDKDNLVAAMVAKKNGVDNTIALVTERTANTQIINIGENILVDRTSIMMFSILKELRRSSINQAYSLGAALGEIWEIVIDENSTLVNSSLQELKLPADSRICALIRDDEVYFNFSDKNFEVKDRIIFFCASASIKKAEKVFV